MMTSSSEGWDKDTLRQYFIDRLETAWDEQGVGTIGLDDDLYVQWAVWPEGLQLETVSNGHLPSDRQLTFVHRRQLQKQGWNSPTGDDLPNYWQRFTERAEVPRAAQVLVDVVGLLTPGLLQADGVAASVSMGTTLPVRRRTSAPEVVLIVPVGEVFSASVGLAVDATVASLRLQGPVALVDLFGVPVEPFDDEPFVVLGDVADAAAETGDVVIVRAGDFVPDDVPGLLRLCADVVDACRSLVEGGRAVVLVGTPFWLDPQMWLYAAAARAEAPRTILCMDGTCSESDDRACLRVLQLDGARMTEHVAVVVDGPAASRPSIVLRSAEAVVYVTDHDDWTDSGVTNVVGHFLDVFALPDTDADEPVAAACRTVMNALVAPLMERLLELIQRQPAPEEFAECVVSLAEDAEHVVRAHPVQFALPALRPDLTFFDGFLVRVDGYVSGTALTPEQQTRLAPALVRLMAIRATAGEETEESVGQRLSAFLLHSGEDTELHQAMLRAAAAHGPALELSLLRAMNAARRLPPGSGL